MRNYTFQSQNNFEDRSCDNFCNFVFKKVNIQLPYKVSREIIYDLKLCQVYILCQIFIVRFQGITVASIKLKSLLGCSTSQKKLSFRYSVFFIHKEQD
jgi:hypothetical protein